MTIHKTSGTTITLTAKAAYLFARKLTRQYFGYRKYVNGWQILYPNTGNNPFLLKISETEFREFLSLHDTDKFLANAFRKAV